MGVDAFVKFCKIGALSATGTRPFDAGADGFVMGEGAALFVLKRLEDAERDGDRVYAVILGVGGSSDGKGKGITAPNPVGQQLAVQRAWERAGVDPATAGAVEAHGTSTRVGDASELTSLTAVFGGGRGGAALHRARLGEVQHRPPQGGRRIGRPVQDGALAARQAAAAQPELPRAQPQRRLGHPAVRRQHRAAPVGAAGERRAPWWRERLRFRRHELPRRRRGARPRPAPPAGAQLRLRRGARLGAGPADHRRCRRAPRAARRLRCAAPSSSGGRDDADLATQVQAALAQARAGVVPARTAPDPALASAAVRVAVDHADAADLTTKLTKLANAFASGNPAAFRLLRQQGIFLGRGPAPEGRVPLHRAGLAVRQHAQDAGGRGAPRHGRRSTRPTG